MPCPARMGIMDRNTDERQRKTGGESPLDRRESALDAERFGQIHHDYRDRLINSLAGMVRDREKAEDIAGQAFQVAWEKREQFRGDASPFTWIQAIARNDARRSWSRERLAQFDSIDLAPANEPPAPELVTDELEKRDDRLRLQTALERVPGKYRRPLIAHFVDGLPVREIARRERVPLGTVLSRIFTAKQLLRHAWEKPIPAPQAGPSATDVGAPQPAERQKSQDMERGAKEPPEYPEASPWDR